MSSYLNIVIPTISIEDNKENNNIDLSNSIPIVCVSASHSLYQAFRDNLNMPFGREKALPLTNSDLYIIYNDIKEEIDNTNKRLVELEKYANGNLDIIQEILSSKEYVKEQTEVFYYIKYLMDTLSTMCEEWRTKRYGFYYYVD